MENEYSKIYIYLKLPLDYDYYLLITIVKDFYWFQREI